VLTPLCQLYLFYCCFFFAFVLPFMSILISKKYSLTSSWSFNGQNIAYHPLSFLFFIFFQWLYLKFLNINGIFFYWSVKISNNRDQMNVIQNFRGKNRFFPYLKKKTTFFFIIVNFSHYSFNFLNNKFKIKINTLNYENK